MEACFYGCNVHAKRIILENLTTRNNNRSNINEELHEPNATYHWVVGTRRLFSELSVATASFEISTMGKK